MSKNIEACPFLLSGSRFTETNNFGFVALDIMYCYPEDTGTYTCRARNAIGEAITSANLNCICKQFVLIENIFVMFSSM